MKKYLWLRFLIVVGIPLSILVFTCCSSAKKEVKTPSKSATVTEKGFNISNDGQAFRIAFYNVENLFDIEDDTSKLILNTCPRLAFFGLKSGTKPSRIT